MSTQNTWLIIPDTSFADSSAWRRVAPNTYGAARFVVLVRKSRGAEPRFGIAEEQYTVAGDY